MSRIYEAMQRAAQQQAQQPNAAPVAARRPAATPAPDNSLLTAALRRPANIGGTATNAVSTRDNLSYTDALPRHSEFPEDAAAHNRKPAVAPAYTNHSAPVPSWQPPVPGVLKSAFNGSASIAHTDDSAGSALSGGITSRAAGATLDAAGTTRVGDNFASVEISPTRVEPHLVAITQPRSAYTEQFRSLRTRILHAGEKRKVQVVVVTSAGVHEGKTLTSLNLAWMLAQTEGVRALLIDSDLRRPCAAQYLGLHAPSGLSEVLAGQVKLEQAIIKLEPAGLYLLPGGEAREDVAEMLAGPTFNRLLKQVRTMFDYIIVDAPPMGVFSDANTLINRADGALLVVRANKTKYKAVERLLDGVPRERMLGVILNQAEEKTADEGYYGYGYGYSAAAVKPRPEVVAT